jgi:hypothetical protein
VSLRFVGFPGGTFGGLGTRILNGVGDRVGRTYHLRFLIGVRVCREWKVTSAHCLGNGGNAAGGDLEVGFGGVVLVYVVCAHVGSAGVGWII